MRRINSYSLALFFYFLRNETLSIPYASNRIPKETLDSLFDTLERIVNRTKPQQNLSFCKEVQNGSFIISVTEAQKHILKDYLQKYCAELKEDSPERRKYNVDEWNVTRQNFINKVVESHKILTPYFVTDIKDILPLAPDLIKLDSSDYKLEIEIKPATKCIKNKSFNFKCCLDLSGIVEEQKKPKQQTEKIEQEEPRRKKFSRQQQKLYNFLKRRAKEGQREFAKYDLRELVPLGNNALNSALNRLNKQHQEIHNTDKKLIEFNRGKGKFILNKEWNFDALD